MIIGILLLSIGALILLTQLLGANFLKLVGLYWPTLLILYGALRLLTDKHRHNFPLFLMAFGAILQAYKLQLFRGNILLILIALCLILLGLRMIINRFSQRHTNYNENVFTDDDDHQQKGTYGYEERDMLNDRFLFADAHRVYRSDSFSGGDIEVVFSSVTLDLKNVLPLDNVVRLNASVQFGELVLQVPADWHVIVNGKHYYSVHEKKEMPEAATTLYVDSEVFAGTLKIL